MEALMDKTPGDPNEPIEPLRGGDRQALAAFFEQHRERLRRMVKRRLDPRLRAYLDASDVVQEAFLDVDRDLDAYLADPKLPPLLWLRSHVGRRLTLSHRQHLGTQMRDAGREISR
jgi:RNA polymerase sigma-70 factor, ECF subfamily